MTLRKRLEAAHWIMRTSFERKSVLYQFPVSQIPVLHLYTRRPCCTHPDHDAPFQRDTCERFMCKGSGKASAPLLFFYQTVVLVSVARQWNCLEPFLEASHPCFDPDSSRGVIVRNTSHCLHLHSIRLRRDFWWRGRVLWSGRAIGIRGYEPKEENLKRKRKMFFKYFLGLVLTMRKMKLTCAIVADDSV